MKIPTLSSTSFLRKLSFQSLLVVTAIASTSNAEITSFKKIGDPVFEVAGHVTGSYQGGSRDVWNVADDIFGPSHVVAGDHPGNNNGPEVGIIPIGEFDMPIEEQARREFAASGRVNTNVFSVEEIFWDRSWVRLLSLSPTSAAPTGASPQNLDGPIIPDDIFPLTQKFELYQNGSHVWTSSVRTRASLGSAGSQTLDDGTQIDFTELNFGDYVVPQGWSAGRGHSLDSLVASYEHRNTITDRNGNGWEYIVPIEAVRHPTDIIGDLNYNGEFDMQDLDILTQNVAVAPEAPHGDFLRRLDLNGDESVDVSDVNHWVTQLKSTFVGDANLDGEVKFDDFLALSANFGQAGGWAEGDFNADEQVDFPDFLALSANFGNVAAATHAEAVPEPTAATIALFGLLGLVGLRKRR